MSGHEIIVRLEPPSLRNFTCGSPFFTPVETSWVDFVKAASLVVLSLGIIASNGLLVATLLSRKHSRFLQSQPRYLLTSLACGNLGVGVLVVPLGVYTSVTGCWPYGEVLCSTQALLVGALCQQNAATLVCMAADRYMCMLYPVAYHKLLSKKGSFGAICFTWVASFSLYVALIVPGNGYFFNAQGIPICEPFYRTNTVAILAACLFYFPPTMVLLYCYGSVFQLAKVKLKTIKCNAITRPEQYGGVSVEKLIMEERRRSMRTSRSLAGMGLAFIAIVTPWTIKQVVTSCTGVEVPAAFDFTVTWLALSNGIWNVLVYTLLSKSFRKSALDLLCGQIFCCQPPLTAGEIASNNSSDDSELISPNNGLRHMPGTSASADGLNGCPVRTRTNATSLPSALGTMTDSNHAIESLLANHGCHHNGPDWDRIGEKFWGEILERTVSSSSLQNLQRVYGSNNQDHCHGNGGHACMVNRAGIRPTQRMVSNQINGRPHHPDHHQQIHQQLFRQSHQHQQFQHQRGCPAAAAARKTSTGTMTTGPINKNIATSSFSTSVDSSESSPAKNSDGAGNNLNNLNTISSKVSAIHGDSPTIPLRVMQEGKVWEMGV